MVGFPIALRFSNRIRDQIRVNLFYPRHLRAILSYPESIGFRTNNESPGRGKYGVVKDINVINC